MSAKQEMIICPNCAVSTMHISNAPNNILHIILSVLTSGGWLLIWGILLVTQKNPQCTKCGNTSTQEAGTKTLGKIVLGIFMALCIGVVFLGFIMGLGLAVA